MNAIEEAGAAYAAANRAFRKAEIDAEFTDEKREMWESRGCAIWPEDVWVAFVAAAKKRDAALRDLIAAVEQAEEQA